MVALPASRYMDDNGKKAKLPAFAIARTEITVGQFRRFIEATGFRTWAEYSRRCNGPGQDWHHPGYAQTDAHPVVCVNELDIKAYVDWLSKLTGQTYLIPNNPQWDFAARANNPNSAIWGDDIATACRHANMADRCFEAGIPEEMNARADFPCNDGYVHPAPVGRFPPNAFGLYDMIGNVEELTNTSFCDMCGGGDRRVRGGGSRSGPSEASFYSVTNPSFEPLPDIGFRPVRVMPR
jgi:serine/threonine-protein kinase PpkA